MKENVRNCCFSTVFICIVASLDYQANAQDPGTESYPYAPYNEGAMDPQTVGWPLSEQERAYALRIEHERRPGREANKHLPQMWPVIPSAGFWGGTSWLDTHARLVEYVQANPGPCDVLLVGDSITQQWGSPLDKGVLNEAWKHDFGGYRTINIGIGGDKAQNLLWRLDHGGVDGIQPRTIILMIGNNNMFFAPETGIDAIAQGVRMCLKNLRSKFPDAEVLLVKVLPAHAPGNDFYENIKKSNLALDPLRLDEDPKIHLLDLTPDFTNANGTLKSDLFTPDNIHLSLAGYAVYATRLKPFFDRFIGPKGLGSDIVLPKPKPTAPEKKTTESKASVEPVQPTTAFVEPTKAMLDPTTKSADGTRLIYPYSPYNEGKMDPQLVGWPLSDAEKTWVAKAEYNRKPGHEVSKHLPELWFVTPTAAHWTARDGTEQNLWLDHHLATMNKAKAFGERIDIALIGDSLTQHWGGGWDGTSFNSIWQKHFGATKTANFGIGGDRIENVLWRLDHGMLDNVSPKVVVLMIGVNNAPLVFANGAPAVSAAHGIKLCVENLRLRCPQSEIVVVKLLPAFDPKKEVGEKVREINRAVDAMKLDGDARVHVVDLWKEFTNADGSLNSSLYSDGHLHLAPEGYDVLANNLKPVLQSLLSHE